MTLKIDLSAEVEARLVKQAAAQGTDPRTYVRQLIEQAVTLPTLTELLSESAIDFPSICTGAEAALNSSRELLEQVRNETMA
jgi:hypothetical protein